jgi:hypothetical protein
MPKYLHYYFKTCNILGGKTQTIMHVISKNFMFFSSLTKLERFSLFVIQVIKLI